MNYTNMIDSCQAYLPVQYASNIELIRQKLHWCCDLQQATPESHVQNKVRKREKIRNRYNQAPHLTQETNGKVTTSQLDITNESQEVIPFQQVTARHQQTDVHESITKQDRNYILCLLFVPLAVRVQAGCSAIPFYILTKPLTIII